MRFVLALVRLLGILLSICLFCAFLYFAFINQQSENAKMFSYGSLVLFVFSTVITSLASVSFENYQNKRQNTAFFNKISDKLQEINVAPLNTAEPQEDKVTPFLEKLTTDGSNTAEAVHLGFEKITKQLAALQEANPTKMLNFGFESLNNRLNEIQEATNTKTEQLMSSFNGLTGLPETIASLVNNIGGDATGGSSPEIEVLQQTVAQIGSELGQNNTKTIDTINKLKTDITDLKLKQQNTDAKLDDIITKLDFILPLVQDMSFNGITSVSPTPQVEPVIEPVVEEEPVVSEPQAEPVIEPVIEEEPVVSEPQAEPVIEPVVEEEPVASEPQVEPVIEPVVEEEPVVSEPQAEPVIESVVEEEPVVSEPQVEPVIEPVVEEEPVASEQQNESVVSKESPATGDSLDLAAFLAGNDITPASLDADDNSWTADGKVLADRPEYEAADPFGTPAQHNLSAMLPAIEGKTDPATYASETPFGSANQGSTEGMPDLPAPTNPALLESDDPYGVPSDEGMPEPPIDHGELQADNPFGVSPAEDEATSDENHAPLDAIFNDKFASEMADLDILKDDTDTPTEKNKTSDFEEIDLSAMFNETNK